VGSKKEDLSVHVETPSASVKPSIMGGNGGNFIIGFSPTVAGQYWFDFCYKGKWSTTPFCVPINEGGNVPSNSYTGSVKQAAGGGGGSNTVSRTGGTTSTASATTKPAASKSTQVPVAAKCTVAGIPKELSDTEPLKFTIKPADEKGLITSPGDWNFDVKFEYKSLNEDNDEQEGESKIPVPQFSPNKDGSISCSCGELEAGEYTIAVSFKGTSVKDSPWTVVVSESISGGSCEVLTLLVHAVNKQGQLKSTGGDLKEFILEHSLEDDQQGNPQISDVGSGKYQIEFMLHQGDNALNVELHGKSLPGFPLTIHI